MLHSTLGRNRLRAGTGTRRPQTMRVTALLAAPLLFATTVHAMASDDDLAAREAAYTKSVTTWYGTWRTRPRLNARDEASCVEAWQTGEKVRTEAASATPPEKFAAYHEALLACMDACLKVSDECLLKPRGGPRFMQYFLAAQRTCREVSRATRDGKLGLPPGWF